MRRPSTLTGEPRSKCFFGANKPLEPVFQRNSLANSALRADRSDPVVLSASFVRTGCSHKRRSPRSLTALLFVHSATLCSHMFVAHTAFVVQSYEGFVRRCELRREGHCDATRRQREVLRDESRPGESFEWRDSPAARRAAAVREFDALRDLHEEHARGRGQRDRGGDGRADEFRELRGGGRVHDAHDAREADSADSASSASSASSARRR